MASTYLTRTPSSTGNRRKFTFSAWVKFNFNQLSNNSRIFGCGSATSAWVSAYFNSDGTLQLAITEGGNTYTIQTNRKFRDESAWYHVVFVVDTENATADNRLRIYVNGQEETSLAQRVNPTQNLDTQANTASKPIDIGSAENIGYTPRYFPGYMSHVAMVDGTVLTPTSFGETDSTTGIWKPKTSPSVTYGTNGFFLKFENSGAMGTDSSGNSNTFTVNGSMTQLIDTPSNVFATQNPLQFISSGCNLTLEDGNTTVSNGCAVGNVSTLGASSGKYYWEGKLISFTNGSGTPTVNKYQIGINGTIFSTNTQFTGSSNPYGYSYLGTGYKGNNGTESTYGDTYGVNDIIGVALDLDNNKLYFSKNGTWQNSGDPTSGATGTGAAYTITAASSTDSGFYFGCCGHKDNLAKWSMNFGNGYFGTTAVTSAQNPDDGNGIFEYDVPAGYRGLCTKSINAEEYS